MHQMQKKTKTKFICIMQIQFILHLYLRKIINKTNVYELIKNDFFLLLAALLSYLYLITKISTETQETKKKML